MKFNLLWRHRYWLVCLGLFVILLAIRLPSFFHSVFDWDESTFILISQSLLDGFLPYIKAWNNKPPGLFYFYAIFILILGKSIVAVRAGGLFVIYLSSLVIFWTADSINGCRAGVISALLFLVFVSSKRYGLSIMPEHLMLLPISIVLFLLFTRPISNRIALITGLVLGIELMIKTNMIFDCLALLLLVAAVWPERETSIPKRSTFVMILLAGILIPVLVFVIIYGVHGQLPLFWQTNIMFNIKYVEHTSFLQKFDILCDNLSDDIENDFLIWSVFVVGCSYLVTVSMQRELRYRKFIAMGLVVFGTQLFSIFYAGSNAYYHYFILLVPIMSLLGGVAIDTFLVRLTCSNIKKNAVLILIVSGIAVGCYSTLDNHIFPAYSDFFMNQSEDNDSCYAISEYLVDHDVVDKSIYIVNDCQIVYWLNDARYTSRYVHPSDMLVRGYTMKLMEGAEASDQKELSNILGDKPIYIVWKRRGWPQPHGELLMMLTRELDQNYSLEKVIDQKYELYARK